MAEKRIYVLGPDFVHSSDLEEGQELLDARVVAYGESPLRARNLYEARLLEQGSDSTDPFIFIEYKDHREGRQKRVSSPWPLNEFNLERLTSTMEGHIDTIAKAAQKSLVPEIKWEVGKD